MEISSLCSSDFREDLMEDQAIQAYILFSVKGGGVLLIG